MTRFKTFDEVAEAEPLDGVNHQIVWWIEREMTLEEWSRLDDLMSEALHAVVGDNFSGYAGPIPEGG